MEAYNKLTAKQAEIAKLSNILCLSFWDSATYLPPASATKRQDENSELAKFIHLQKTSAEYKKLLAEACEEEPTLDSLAKRNLELIKQEYDNAKIIPAELLAKHSKITSKCEHAWRDLRRQNDFAKLAPYLEEVFNITKEIAQIKADYHGIDKYEALVDSYDPGRKVSEIDQVMQATKRQLPSIIDQICERQSKQSLVEVNSNISPKTQLAISHRLAGIMGFDFNRGRIDETVHPFCGGTRDDVRLTTRFVENNPLFGLYGVIHETGHGLYQQNLPKQYDYQPLGGHFGMSFHESQSLIMEMNIGSSMAFCQMFARLLRDDFGLQGQEYSAENLYKAINKVNPSLIRIEADQVTYPMHIVLRYELEQAILAGDIKAKDLPTAWNEKMQQYLGIKPDDEANGCMQDVHWHKGNFGYFPSYYLGSIIASMVMQQMQKALPEIDTAIASGDFSAINSYLNDNFRKLGKSCSSQELLQKATSKSQIDSNCFFDYINDKFLA